MSGFFAIHELQPTAHSVGSGLLGSGVTASSTPAFPAKIADSNASTVGFATADPLTTSQRALSAQVLAIVPFP